MLDVSNVAAITILMRDAAKTLVEAADYFEKEVVIPASDEKSTNEPVSATESKLKLEDVRAVLADLSRKGHTAAIRDLLIKHGADKLSAIDPSMYGALLEEAKELENA